MNGQIDGLNPELLMMLAALERNLGHTITINSGLRQPDHNAQVGGVKDSAHLTGNAVDIACEKSWDRFRFVFAAKVVGFRRIGIGNTFIHLDNSSVLPQDVMWDYY